MNLLKSNFVIVGNKKDRRKIAKELENNPLKLCGQNMEEVKEIKFLGDYIGPSCEESIHTTVSKRISIAKQTINEIRTIIEDRRAKSIGGINIAFDIFNAAVIPMVLNNGETWWNMKKKTLKALNGLFNYFFRLIFRIGSGCPVINFYIQVGCLKVEAVLLRMQLNFCYHLANLSPSALGRQTWDLQVNHRLPGLYLSVEDHLNKLNFHQNKSVSKWQWEKLVREYTDQFNLNLLDEEAKRYKKVSFDKY